MDPPFYVLSPEPSSFERSTPNTSLSPSSHDTSRAKYHIEDVEAFAADLNNAAKSAFPNRGRSRYKTVNVALIRWEEDELDVQYELGKLNHLMQDYAFRTDVWLIPNTDSHWELMSKTLNFIRSFDNDKNLFILYYAGHGRINDARQAEWVCSQSPNSSSVDWSAIQSLFAKAKSDVLILLDTCAAASSASKSEYGVMEAIVACGFEARAPPPGEHSFTNMLINVLEDWINKPSFSAASLHTEILFQLKQKETRKGREGIKLEWCVTPIHIRYTQDTRAPGIELCRRNTLPMPQSGLSNEPSRTTTFVDAMDIDFDETNASSSPLSSLRPSGHFQVPHVLISIALEENQPELDVKTCVRWLEGFPLLAKWANIEGVYPSFSTVLILTVPMPVWDMLPDHPACMFIGYATAPSRLPRSVMLGSTNNPRMKSMKLLPKRPQEPLVPLNDFSQWSKSSEHASFRSSFGPAYSNSRRNSFSEASALDQRLSTTVSINAISVEEAMERQIRGQQDLLVVRKPSMLTSPLNKEEELWHDPGNLGSETRTGLNPESRTALSEVEIPNLKEQTESRFVSQRIAAVEEWRTQIFNPAQETFDGDVELLPFWDMIENMTSISNNLAQETISAPLSVNTDIDVVSPVSDSASVRENALVEGQTYFKIETLSPVDWDIISQPRHWSDAPSVPQILTTSYQPKTGNDAIKQWNGTADTFSELSRAATWGTRRRSEPSLADWEGIADGSFLKKLSISKPPPAERPLRNVIFDRLASMMSKEQKGKLKRTHNANEAVSNDTAKIVRGRTQSASVLEQQTRMLRGKRFTKSFRRQTSTGFEHDDGIVQLWRGFGGPPVPTMAISKLKNTTILPTDGEIPPPIQKNVSTEFHPSKLTDNYHGGSSVAKSPGGPAAAITDLTVPLITCAPAPNEGKQMLSLSYSGPDTSTSDSLSPISTESSCGTIENDEDAVPR